MTLEYKGLLRYFKLILILVMVLPLLPVNAQKKKKVENEVIQAYELRINGKLDSAKTILENIIQLNPTNAMANFEMARVMDAYNKMNVDSSLYFCNKAVLYAPDNSMYAFNKANFVLLKAFIAAQQGNNSKVKSLVDEACKAFQHVLEIKPDCKESLMYLIDMYGTLPKEMGGDKEKARFWVEKLENLDKFYGARGRFILLQEDTSEVGYWKNYISENGENNKVLELLGDAYLMSDDPENAEKCFNKIIDSDPTKQVLYLQLARLHIYWSMMGKKPREEEIPQAEKYFQKYLSGDQEKPVCIESWVYGFLSQLEKFSGNNEQSDKYLEKAMSLDPNFSRATALPTVDSPPDKIVCTFSSYFRPF